MATLNNWRSEIARDTSQINDNLTTILKEDLAEINRTSQELKAEISDLRKENIEIKNYVRGLDSKYDELREDINVLQKSAQFSSDQQELDRKTVESLSKDMKAVQCFKHEIEEVKKQNAELKYIINDNEQRERLLNLEIMGIPEFKDEKLSEFITQIASKGGVVLEIGDIIHVNRVSPRSKVQGRPRVIIAKMRTRLLKDNIVAGTRKCHLTTKALNIPGDSRPIYVNEHLTVFNKLLLKKCKEQAKNKQYQYVWSKNGKIFIRKNDTAPALLISKEDDLKKFI